MGILVISHPVSWLLGQPYCHSRLRLRKGVNKAHAGEIGCVPLNHAESILRPWQNSVQRLAIKLIPLHNELVSPFLTPKFIAHSKHAYPWTCHGYSPLSPFFSAFTVPRRMELFPPQNAIHRVVSMLFISSRRLSVFAAFIAPGSAVTSQIIRGA